MPCDLKHGQSELNVKVNRTSLVCVEDHSPGFTPDPCRYRDTWMRDIPGLTEAGCLEKAFTYSPKIPQTEARIMFSGSMSASVVMLLWFLAKGAGGGWLG